MLSRTANNLFWMGRYIERSEHLGRYLKVQYFSSLDAPISQQKEFTLQSIMNMVGLPYEQHTLLEEDVLVSVALDESNPSSIASYVLSGRENARGARDIISSELWEAINKYYHFVNDYPVDIYKTKGLFDFTQNVIEHCSIVKGNIENTLLHDEVWSFIKLGIHIERSAQITRILWSKVNDISRMATSDLGKSIETYQWTTLLKSTEAMDMSRRIYKAPPNRINALEILILNKNFPRSIVYNLSEVKTYLDKISKEKISGKNSVEFKVGKLTTSYNYLTIEEIESNVQDFLNDTLNHIYSISELLENEYLHY